MFVIQLIYECLKWLVVSEIVMQDAAGVVGQRKRRPSSFPHGTLPLVEPGCASSAARSLAAGLLAAASSAACCCWLARCCFLRCVLLLACSLLLPLLLACSLLFPLLLACFLLLSCSLLLSVVCQLWPISDQCTIPIQGVANMSFIDAPTGSGTTTSRFDYYNQAAYVDSQVRHILRTGR